MCGDKMKNLIYIQNYIRTHKAEPLYNKVSNILYTEFDIKSAEISLLATYVVLKNQRKGRCTKWERLKTKHYQQPVSQRSWKGEQRYLRMN